MSTRTFVDTLFVVALVNRRDQYHQQASKLADQLAGQPLLITDAVLLEIGNALARNYKVEATAIIDDFFTSDEVEIVHLTPELFEKDSHYIGNIKIKHGAWWTAFRLWSCAVQV